MRPALHLSIVLFLVLLAALAVGITISNTALVIGSCLFAAGAIGVVGYLVTAGG